MLECKSSCLGPGDAKRSLFQKNLVELNTLKFLEIKQGMSVLDIACGNGQISRVLAHIGRLLPRSFDISIGPHITEIHEQQQALK